MAAEESHPQVGGCSMDSLARGCFVAGWVEVGWSCHPRAYATWQPLLSRFRRFSMGLRPARRDRAMRRTGRVPGRVGICFQGVQAVVERRIGSSRREREFLLFDRDHGLASCGWEVWMHEIGGRRDSCKSDAGTGTAKPQMSEEEGLPHNSYRMS